MNRRTLCLLLPVVVVVAAFALPNFYVSLCNYIGLYAIVGVGLVLLTGSAGLTSFGQAAFVGVGAYTTGLLATQFGISPWLTLPAAVLSSALMAIAVGAVTVRLSGHYLILGTMAWGIALYYFLGNSEALGGHNGMTGIPPVVLLGYPLDTVRTGCVLIWAFVLLSFLLTANLLDSGPGRSIRVLRNTELARAFGVNTARLRLVAFVYAAVLAGVAGWLQAHYLRFISPSSFSIVEGFNYVFMIVIGGSSHLVGAFLGPAAFVLIQSLLQGTASAAGLSAGRYDQIVFGIIIIVIIRSAATGLTPFFAQFLRRQPAVILPNADALPRRSDDTSYVENGPLLEVRGVRKAFGGLVAVDNVDFSVERGEILALIGPNGAGKTTLFNLISGELSLDAGSIWLQGKRLDGTRPYRVIERGLARTFQQVRLMPSMTLLENVAIGANVRTHAGIVAAALHAERREEGRVLMEAATQLRRVGLGDQLSELASNLPLGLQRVAEIARALCADPSILLLDEPAAGLRFHEKQALAVLLDDLRKSGISILLVEHDMEFLMDLADRIVVMNFGRKLAEGKTREVQADPKVIDAYLGYAA